LLRVQEQRKTKQKEMLMNRIGRVSLGVGLGLAAMLSGFLVFSSTRASAARAPAPQPAVPAAGEPSFGTAVRPASERQWIAAQVLVVSDELAQPTPLFVARATFNRLRDEAGVSKECDLQGLEFSVVVGAEAEPWGLTPGSTVHLMLLESGIDVPEANIAGDGWFAHGVAAVSLPAGCS
jgi:hypothetical protein